MKRRCAIFCPVRDETLFSPIWSKYYSRFFSENDIYFLDFGSAAAHLKDFDGQVVSTNANILDATSLFHEIKRFHAHLLTRYQYVIPTDVDELLYVEGGLDEYIGAFKGDDVRSNGYEIIHLPDVEPPYDFAKPLFCQRRYWYSNNVDYGKTLLTNRTLNWSIGLHACAGSSGHYDPNLYLIHLHRFDFDLCVERHLRWAQMPWSEDTVARGYNWHYRMTDPARVKEWYFSTRGGSVERIPERIRSSLSRALM